MARTGRPRIPTHLKIVAGNRGKRRLPIETEPQPEKVAPPCPKHIQGEARKEWRRASKQLLEMNILTKVDRAALAAYCQAWARWVDAEKRLQDEPMVFKSPNGYPVISPYWVIANKAMEQIHRFLIEFGFSPASRTRIKGSAAPETDKENHDPAKKYFG